MLTPIRALLLAGVLLPLGFVAFLYWRAPTVPPDNTSWPQVPPTKSAEDRAADNVATIRAALYRDLRAKGLTHDEAEARVPDELLKLHRYAEALERQQKP